MRIANKLPSYTMANIGIAVIGVAAFSALLLAYVLLESLRPKMVAFQPLTASEEGLVNYVGVGLLLALLFCTLALARIIRFATRVQRLSPFHLLVIAGGVLTPLFIFGDIALLNDIGKQYEHGLSQPEWGVLYVVLALQIIAITLLLYTILFTLNSGDTSGCVARDSSVFLLGQFVGMICGGVGLVFTSLNFFYPRPPWMVQQQMTPTLIILLSPYTLMVILWLIVTRREGGAYFDEKQRTDVGASAFATLVSSALAMAAFYFFSLRQQSSMAGVLWFPFYAFLTLLLFSASNLYRSRDSIF